jgi:glycerol kinase
VWSSSLADVVSHTTHNTQHINQLINRPVVQQPLQENTVTCIKMAMEKAEVERAQLEAVGITNQRESALIWNK